MSGVAIEITVEAGEWPAEDVLQALAARAIGAACEAMGDGVSGELSIVFTDDAAMRALNKQWRGKDAPTNVLSFPQESGPQESGPQENGPQENGPQENGPQESGPQESGKLLGDVIMAAETVRREAELADKPLEDHMAHLLIHGFLHLLGHDHESDAEAEKMEQLERVALRRMGIPDPYATPRRQ